MSWTDDRETFEELKTSGQLPSPGGVALKVLSMAQQEDVSVNEIAEVLRVDPALTGKILKYANSASQGARRPAVAIKDAIVRLGLKVVNQLILGFSLVSHNRKSKCEAFDYTRFWAYSLAMGAAIRELAGYNKLIDQEEGFTCGLLGHIGKLAFAHVYPEQYRDVLRQWNNQADQSLETLEDEAFALTSDDLTAFLMEEWGLPEVCVDAIRYCHRLDQATFEENSRPEHLSRLLNLGEKLAEIITTDKNRVDAIQAIPQDILRGYSLEILLEFCETIDTNWREWGTVLEIDTQALPEELWYKGKGDAAADGGGQKEDAEAQDVKPASPKQGDEEGAKPPAEKARNTMRILAMDSDAGQMAVYSRLFEGDAYQMFQAARGDEGIMLALKERPHLIIADQKLPDMDAIDLCRHLRKSEEIQGICILICAAELDDQDILAVFEAGADDYIDKSGNPELIRARVEAVHRIIRLQGQNRQKTEDIKNYVSELSSVNRKLRKAMKARNEFLQKMSHELRTPINGIVGMLQLMGTTKLTEEQSRFVDVAYHCCQDLNALISDILDYSRIETGALALRNKDFDVRKLVGDVLTFVTMAVRRKQLKLSCLIQKNLPPMLQGDAEKVKQVLYNLLDNAVKFTEKGEVCVTVNFQADKTSKHHVILRFAVKDSGIGIPDAQTNKLFQSFSQLENKLSYKVSGTGLGLVICKALSEKMGGRIGVDSEPGKGSTFWFTCRLEKQKTI